MNFWTYMDNRAREFGVLDTILIQGAGMFFGLFMGALIPQIMNVHWAWFAVLVLVTTAKPSSKFWFKALSRDRRA